MSDRDEAWARSAPARVAREAIICGVFDGLISYYCKRTVQGHERLDALDGPAIFVANHASHADTPVLLRSLPARFRRRTAVAAAADYFYVKRHLAAAVSLSFGTIPLERRGGGMDEEATVHLRKLIDDGWSLVVYAEGTRSRDGSVGKLRSGAAVMAAQYGLPIVPVHTQGLHVAMPTGKNWMKRPSRFERHPISVTFGPPIHVAPRDDRFEVMEQVRLFLASRGAETTQDPKLLRRRAAATKAS
jgi:1-acyl-sn-glycerol-3-phosphate acyltransferase